MRILYFAVLCVPILVWRLYQKAVLVQEVSCRDFDFILLGEVEGALAHGNVSEDDVNVEHDRVEINYSSFSIDHDWLSKTCRLADGHATRIHEVYLLAIVVWRLNSLSVFKRIVAQIDDQVVDELLLAVHEELAEPANNFAKDLLHQLVLQLRRQLLIEAELFDDDSVVATERLPQALLNGLVEVRGHIDRVVGALKQEQPFIDPLVHFVHVMVVVRVVPDYLLHGDLYAGKQNHTKELNAHGVAVFESCAARVVAVTHGRDNRADPVDREDVDAIARVPLEILIRQLPG